MKEDVRRAALAALSASSHFHKGIRPAGAADQEEPCQLLTTDDPQPKTIGPARRNGTS